MPYAVTEPLCVDALVSTEAIWGTDLSKHWLKEWFVTWKYQTITLANVDGSAERFSESFSAQFYWLISTNPPLHLHKSSAMI